tara:strand:+ start:2193 stop:3020 length:828 start_codon:yes stop_codon:yes gene_type:complete
MSDENPVIDSEEELVETLGTTENETQEEETEELEVENEDNAESENEEPSEEVETTSTKVEKQGNLPKGAQKRIDKLTKQREQKDAKIADLEAQLEYANKFLEQPEPENLEDLSISEQVKHGVQRNGAEQQKQQLEAQKQQVIAEHKAQVWEAKKQEKAEVYTDFDQVMASTAQTFNLSPQNTAELMQFIGDSDVGVDLAYYLAKNPHEANALENLGTMAKATKLMKLELKLENQQQTQPTKPITKAKQPISKTKGSATATKSASNTRDFWKNIGK